MRHDLNSSRRRERVSAAIPRQLRLVQLHRVGSGFSNSQETLRSVVYLVAAPSVRSAYELALASSWSTGPSYPTGIVQVHVRDAAHDRAFSDVVRMPIPLRSRYRAWGRPTRGVVGDVEPLVGAALRAMKPWAPAAHAPACPANVETAA